MTKHKFNPSNMHNIDETGIYVVHDSGKMLTEKRKWRVGAVTNGNREKNITIIFAMSASRKFISLLEKDEPPDAQYAQYYVTPSGWTKDEIETFRQMCQNECIWAHSDYSWQSL